MRLLYSTEQTPYQLFNIRLWGVIPSHIAKGFVRNMTRQQAGSPVYRCSKFYLPCSAVWAYEALSALSLDKDYKFDERHLEDAKVENGFFTAPPFNIKNILTVFNKPAITLCQYSVDTIFSTHVIQCHPINVVVHQCWHHLHFVLFTITLLVLKGSLKSLLFFLRKVNFYKGFAAGHGSVLSQEDVHASALGMVFIKSKALLKTGISAWISTTQ